MNHPILTAFVLTLLALVGGAERAIAQNSSLYSKPSTVMSEAVPANGMVSNSGVSLSQGSWIFRQNPLPKQLRLHDLITIRVDEKAITKSEGEMERRKTGSFDLKLLDWINFAGLSIRPDSHSGDDRRIRATVDELLRAEGDIETLERVTFDITAEIVDIRPNGNLVLEAHKVVRINDESWQYSLSGICRIDDITPSNLVLSANIAELSVHKRERGNVRDSYRRGWLTKWYDNIRPF